jgi:succinate dehydrogenase / fumarate reductase, flavoprotein subunit
MAIASEAVLTALDFYIRNGGGSRGARSICDPAGALTPITQNGPLTEFCFLPERPGDRENRIFVRCENGLFSCEARPIRRRARVDPAFFERDWPRFLSGAIYGRSAS